MDKIFEQNVIEQDNILCKAHPEILKIISECLSPIDVVHLSHTCKELHQKLPFYLLKSETSTISASLKGNFLFEGPASNFSISEINISFTAANSMYEAWKIAVWVQIIRSGTVALETQKYFITNTEGNYQIKIKNATLQEYKGGDRLRFMGQQMHQWFNESFCCIHQLSLKLENDKHDRPIDITGKVKGYSDFKYPSVSIDIGDASEPYYLHWKDPHLSLHGLLKYPLEGNNNFWIIKLLDCIFDSATRFLFSFYDR